MSDARERQDMSDPVCRGEETMAYFRAYADWIAPRCRGKVLDIGCGLGYLSREIAENDAVETVIGTDRYSDPPKEQLHRKLRIIVVDTRTLIENLDWGKFDTIVSTEHIEHLPEELHEPLLQWVVGQLAPGGRFLGSMPHNETGVILSPFHVKEYSAEQWNSALSRHFKFVAVAKTRPDQMVWDAFNE